MSARESSRLTARDVMHVGVITCPPTATLRTVGRMLAAHRIHAVVVASEEEPAPIAVVTDRDVVWSYVRSELDRVTARDAATEPVVTVRADTDLRRAAELMSHFGTSHVVVTTSGGGKPIGILSSLDITNALAKP